MSATTSSMLTPATNWPIAFDDVIAARERLRPFLPPTPLRNYPLLDELVGEGIQVFVKHENHQPTQAFKVRNGLNSIAALDAAARARGVVGASTGNHGQGLAWAGRELGVRVTICVPEGNNPEKNAAIRGYGAELVEAGETYDDACTAADIVVAERGATLIHSTNNRDVIAGAATMSLEMLEQEHDLDAIVVSVGGGSQAVGAITVAREIRPSLRVYGVQSGAAPAVRQAWITGEVRDLPKPATFAEGIATGRAYDLTLGALRQGLAGFELVSERELEIALRALLTITHNLPEGAGAAALAGLLKLRSELKGQRVAIVMSGGNLDTKVLGRILSEVRT